MFGLTPETKVKTDDETLRDLLKRGVSEIIELKKLEESLKKGTSLRVKFGIDPTSPHIHLGRAVVLWKLRAFQDAGHTAVLIIGDFTGQIGDTSDKDSERPMLSGDQIKNNLKTYFEQAGKIIDIEKAEKHYNSKWLGKLGYSEIGKHADAFSVADFISRENIKKRLDAGKRVSLRELLYPLMQGYDSVVIKADLELGGTDQKFNMLAGRTLQEKLGLRPQNLLMTKFPLSGTDGRKMSSSWGNTINISESPREMYGKIMSINDSVIEEYFNLATRTPYQELEKITDSLRGGALHPKEAKMRLAKEIVKLYHGEKAAEEAEKNFTKAFVEGGAPDDTKEVLINEGETLSEILIAEKLISSKSEFARLVESGAVEIVGGEKVKDIKVAAQKNTTYKIGKHRFLKTK